MASDSGDVGPELTRHQHVSEGPLAASEYGGKTVTVCVERPTSAGASLHINPLSGELSIVRASPLQDTSVVEPQGTATFHGVPPLKGSTTASSP